MKVYPFADSEGASPFTNYLLDAIMPGLPANAWKVLCFVIRKTRGFNKDQDRLSYSQIEQGTGIGSSATVSTAVKVLLEKKYIVKVPGNPWKPMGYRLNSALEIEVLDGSSDLEIEELSALETKPLDERSASISKALKTKALRDSDLEIEALQARSALEIEDTIDHTIDKTHKNTHVGNDPLYGLMFEAIARVCRIDLKLCTKTQRYQVAQTSKVLRAGGKTPEEVPKVESWWYSYDWRGKKGDAPRPGQLQDVWEQAMTQERANGLGNNQAPGGRMVQRNGHRPANADIPNRPASSGQAEFERQYRDWLNSDDETEFTYRAPSV